MAPAEFFKEGAQFWAKEIINVPTKNSNFWRVAPTFYVFDL